MKHTVSLLAGLLALLVGGRAGLAADETGAPAEANKPAAGATPEAPGPRLRRNPS
jgi:hypothetical protein